jgi:hypothetical protein
VSSFPSRFRVGLPEPAWIVLLLKYIKNRGRQILLAKDPANAPSIGPPMSSPFALGHSGIRLLLV